MAKKIRVKVEPDRALATVYDPIAVGSHFTVLSF